MTHPVCRMVLHHTSTTFQHDPSCLQDGTSSHLNHILAWPTHLQDGTSSHLNHVLAWPTRLQVDFFLSHLNHVLVWPTLFAGWYFTPQPCFSMTHPVCRIRTSSHLNHVLAWPTLFAGRYFITPQPCFSMTHPVCRMVLHHTSAMF